MSGQKICGYDLNGWVDRAARNWIIGADGEETIGADRCFVNGAVVQPAVVFSGNQRWIGGAQAALAPHGRGDGWGKIGHKSLRRSVHSILDQRDGNQEKDLQVQLAAALQGLACGAKICAVGIDDHPDRSEVLHERILGAISKGKLGRGLLVWRSVLSVLWALRQDEPPFVARDGLTIGVVGHVAEGLTVQRLRLRREVGKRREVFAPERRRAAHAIDGPWGYAGLFEDASDHLKAQYPDFKDDWTEHLQAKAALALGLELRPELARFRLQDFNLIEPIAAEPPKFDFPDRISAELAGCDVILAETQLRGERRDIFSEALVNRLGAGVIFLPDDAIAIGALEAARRHASGEPVYFDFLPQISTIVLSKTGSVSHDLIEKDATLPAGRVYHSPHPATFAIQKGQADFSVYLRKETSKWPRKAQVHIGEPVSQHIPVSLRVEQVPAAGRAKLLIDAPSIFRQFSVDWDGAEEIETPWSDLIAELDDNPATIPPPLVLSSNSSGWYNPKRGTGLATLLEQNVDKAEVDWKALAQEMASSFDKTYCISSDGILPEEVDDAHREMLARLSDRAMHYLRERIAGRIVGDNEPLKFLTWQFRHAPSELAEMLLDAWDEQNLFSQHAFMENSRNRVLIFQGLGRVCKSPEHERAALNHIVSKPIRFWQYRAETAAASFILSRSATAPLLLERKDVEILAARVILEFRGELKTAYTKFNYAPSLLVGLLRWRLREPKGLIAGHDPVADRLMEAVSATLEDFLTNGNVSHSLKTRYTALLTDIQEELKGNGRNPGILIDLY